MEKSLCFVIMGFGKKFDPCSNRYIDLDATYKKIIRPAVIKAKCECIRADEITESGVIDRSMYALLYQADVVIADISTYNPNAIYELGVRHTMKPYSTIIIKEKSDNLPFDLGHNRVLSYSHLGNDISNEEATEQVPKLENLIKKVIANQSIDSPLYTYIPSTKSISIPPTEIEEIIKYAKNNENCIYSLTEKAMQHIRNNQFVDAAQIWGILSKKVENEEYYIQQQALYTYKSKYPNEMKALTDALLLLGKISESTDAETLGIRGAINKNLYKLTNNHAYIDSAIDSYKTSWHKFKSYYCGENYATCLLLKCSIETNDNLKIYNHVEATNTIKEVIDIILHQQEDSTNDDLLWQFATLSNSYLLLNDIDKSKENETKFFEQNPLEWQIKTFEETKELYKKLSNIII